MSQITLLKLSVWPTREYLLYAGSTLLLLTPFTNVVTG